MSAPRILLGLVTVVAGWFLKRQVQKLQQEMQANSRTNEQTETQARQHKRQSNRSSEPLNMVACAHCGVHIPENEAITRSGQHYCCPEHANA